MTLRTPVRSRAVRLAWSLALLAALGCSPSRDQQSSSSTSTSTDSSGGIVLDKSTPSGLPEDHVAVDDALSLPSIDREGWQQFLTDHRGQVVLLDFWATWCQPCMEGLPHTLDLGRKYAAQDVIVVTLALEDESSKPQVKQVLSSMPSQHATHFISAYGGSDGRAMDEFEIMTGTIPTLKLYDQNGELAKTFGDGLPYTAEEIEVEIRQLLHADSE